MRECFTSHLICPASVFDIQLASCLNLFSRPACVVSVNLPLGFFYDMLLFEANTSLLERGLALALL